MKSQMYLMRDETKDKPVFYIQEVDVDQDALDYLKAYIIQKQNEINSTNKTGPEDK